MRVRDRLTVVRRGLAGLALPVLLTMVAAPVPATAAEPATALVRIAHFVPDLSYVDVYAVSLDRTRLMPNVFYRDVSGYVRLPAGRFTYEVRSAGAPTTSAPLVSTTSRLAPGGVYTAASVGRRGSLRAVILPDHATGAASGAARVRVLNVADGLGPVQVAVAGTRARFARAAFAAPSGYAHVPAGRYRVVARRPGGAVLARGGLTARAGAVTTLALVGGAGSPREVVEIQDAMGVSRMPSGGLATGGGGTAPAPEARPRVRVAGLGLLLAAGVLLLGLARRRPGARPTP